METKKTFIYSILGLALLPASEVMAQQSSDYKIARTEWGQPDLQGVWNFSSSIPMQRPQQFGEREFLTEEEIQQALERRARASEEADALAARVSDQSVPEVGDNPGGYNDFWFEVAAVSDVVRTSLIVYPTNGRFPEAVEGTPVQYDSLGPDIPGTRPVRNTVGGIAKDGPEDRALSERCIVGFNSGPPFTPSLYNNNMQIIQSKDTAVIMTEMIHDARIVPLVDKPDLHDDIRLWSGDSRGYFDGDTLVVETKNFNGLRQTFNYRGTNYDMVLTERFTRNAYDSMDYEFTIDDPSTYKDKVTAIVPMAKVAGQIYEYACHEGNYGMVNILRGERMKEARAMQHGQ